MEPIEVATNLVPQKYTVKGLLHEFLNEFTVEDLQYREKGWNRVHEDE